MNWLEGTEQYARYYDIIWLLACTQLYMNVWTDTLHVS